MEKAINFSEIKKELQDVLNEKLKKTPILNEENLTLIDGFMSLPIHQLSNTLTIGGPNIPIVGILGASGRIYTFALKALLPNLSS